MVSALDSAVSGSSYADGELAALFSDAAQLRAWLRVEATLAGVQESLGIIPAGMGSLIQEQLARVTLDRDDLADGYRRDGIPIPALVQNLRQQLAAPAGHYLHYGATSQDIIDTGLVLRLQAACEVLSSRLDCLTDLLRQLADRHRQTLMVARTRKQNAAPTVFGLMVVDWLAPLQRQRARLQQLSPRLLVVQLGGAVGTLAALDQRGLELNEALAEALDLAPENPWHVQRDGIVEFGNWLSMTSSLVGKMGQDLLLLAQSGIGEVVFTTGGKSSTMPNKSNPVRAENLVALASFCQGKAATLQQSLLATQARDGVSLSLEQLALGPLVCACGASLEDGAGCLEQLQVNSQKMQDNIAGDQGMLLAEAAVYTLSRAMDRDQAVTLVARACELSSGSGIHMIDELRKLVDADIDWEALRQPGNYLGVADQIIDNALNG